MLLTNLLLASAALASCANASWLQMNQRRASSAAQPTPNPNGVASIWGQCGGTGWPGPYSCTQGTYCNRTSDYYSQCVPPTVGGNNGGNNGGSQPGNPGPNNGNVPAGYVTSVVVITYTQVVGQVSTIHTTITSAITTTVPVAVVTTQTFTELVPAPTTSTSPRVVTVFQTRTVRASSDPNVVYVTETVTVGGDGSK